MILTLSDCNTTCEGGDQVSGVSPALASRENKLEIAATAPCGVQFLWNHVRKLLYCRIHNICRISGCRRSSVRLQQAVDGWWRRRITCWIQRLGYSFHLVNKSEKTFSAKAVSNFYFTLISKLVNLTTEITSH